MAAILVIWVGVFQVPKLFRGGKSDNLAAAANGAAPAESASGSSAAVKPVAPPASADIKVKLQAAGEYTERKEYPMAEDIYKQVLKAEPNNVDALKGLASVLYREDKIESAAILDKLPKTN